MLHRKGVATLAACVALACTGIVRADGNGAGSANGPGARPTYLDDATTVPSTEPASQPATAPTPPKPLMAGLDALHIGKPLEDANITIGGYFDGGYTVSANGDNRHTLMAGRVFDTKNNCFVFDQADIFIDRPVDYAKAASNHTIDVGGHVEFNYGWDAGLYHSSGIFDNPATLGVTSGFYRSRTSPENQFDMLQAYVDVALPVGTGLRIRAGKFVTPIGYEVINPSQNAFYSHSFLFGFAIPFTQTGIMGEYKINDDWTVDGGITRGWNQSLKDNNGSPDLLGTVTYTPQASDELKKWKFIANLSEGPQGTHDSGDWWTLIDLQAVYTLNTSWTFALNGDYGDAPHVPGLGGAAQWYGIAGYADWTLNKYLTPNLRLEYYGDSKGFTLGTGRHEDLYEVTVNGAIKPLPDDTIWSNLVIRPELRYDYSNNPFYKGGTRHDQLTFGIDAYFTF